MPELPEVETVRRGLEPVMAGAVIAQASVNRPDLRWPFPPRMAERLTGQRVLGLRRRSKYILADLSSGETLLVHLGMSGRMLISGAVLGQFHHAHPAPQKHDHVVLDMESGARVTFNDARRFGAMDLMPTAGAEGHVLLAGLGLGALVALLSNLTYAMGSRFSVTALPGMTPLGRVTLTLLGAGMAATIAALLQELTVGSGEWGRFGLEQVLALALFSIGGMAISQLLWIASIGKLGIGVSSLHINAAAFYVMIFAWMLGSAWNWVQVAGAVIVGIGVLVAQGVIPTGVRHAKP